MIHCSSLTVWKVRNRYGGLKAAPLLEVPYLPYLPHLTIPRMHTHRSRRACARARSRICLSFLVWKVWKVWKTRVNKGLQPSIPFNFGLEGMET